MGATRRKVVHVKASGKGLLFDGGEYSAVVLENRDKDENERTLEMGGTGNAEKNFDLGASTTVSLISMETPRSNLSRGW